MGWKRVLYHPKILFELKEISTLSSGKRFIFKYAFFLGNSCSIYHQSQTHRSLQSTKASIDSTMASLKWVHSFIPGINQWNNPMNDDFLSKIMSSSRRRNSKNKNKKTPISGQQIHKIISSSNLEDLLELRNCLIIAIAYCLLLRHDEFSHLALNHFVETNDGFKITIPKSKTDKYRNGSHVLLKKCSNEISPFMLLKRYLSDSNLKANRGKSFLVLSFQESGKRSKKSKQNSILLLIS